MHDKKKKKTKVGSFVYAIWGVCLNSGVPESPPISEELRAVNGGWGRRCQLLQWFLIKLSRPHILKKDGKVVGDLWEEEGVGGRQEKL